MDERWVSHRSSIHRFLHFITSDTWNRETEQIHLLRCESWRVSDWKFSLFIAQEEEKEWANARSQFTPLSLSTCLTVELGQRVYEKRESGCLHNRSGLLVKKAAAWAVATVALWNVISSGHLLTWIGLTRPFYWETEFYKETSQQWDASFFSLTVSFECIQSSSQVVFIFSLSFSSSVAAVTSIPKHVFTEYHLHLTSNYNARHSISAGTIRVSRCFSIHVSACSKDALGSSSIRSITVCSTDVIRCINSR